MPKIKFKLKDPKYCDRNCNKLSFYCQDENAFCECPFKIDIEELFFKKHYNERPQACIDKFGE